MPRFVRLCWLPVLLAAHPSWAQQSDRPMGMPNVVQGPGGGSVVPVFPTPPTTPAFPAGPMGTSNQMMAMQIYASSAVNDAETAKQAFRAAAEAQNKGVSLLAERELQIARHGVANTAIAKAELASGEATLQNPHNANAAVAAFHEKMAREQQLSLQQANSTDEVDRVFYHYLHTDLMKIEAQPGRYSGPDGADMLTRENPVPPVRN